MTKSMGIVSNDGYRATSDEVGVVEMLVTEGLRERRAIGKSETQGLG